MGLNAQAGSYSNKAIILIFKKYFKIHVFAKMH